MSCHGVLSSVEDHDTSCDVANADVSRLLIQFKYPEAISHHNWTKHWVDYSNNWWHDPIALSDVWRTKWLPNGQFTFLLEEAWANVAIVRGCARNVKAEWQLEFWCALAQRMSFNHLDDDGKSMAQVEQPKTCSKVYKIENDHTVEKRPFFTGEWNDKKEHGRMWKIITREHLGAVFTAKSGAKPFVVVMRRWENAWNVTGSMWLMLELQSNRSQSSFKLQWFFCCFLQSFLSSF